MICFPTWNLIWEFKTLNSSFSFLSSLKHVKGNSQPHYNPYFQQSVLWLEVFFGWKCFSVTQTLAMYMHLLQGVSVQLFSLVWLFATPWTAACQAFLSITNSRSLLKLMSIESVMPSKHLILCCPFLLPPSIFPSIRVFSNESVLHIRWPKVSTGDDTRSCIAAVYHKLSLCPLPMEKVINVLKYNQIRELIQGTDP